MHNVIYKITNTENGKSYIGRAKHFKKRMNAHISLSLKDEPKQHIHRSIKKFGWENFSKTILEENVENMSEREMFFIDKHDTFKNGYNMTSGGENNDGYVYGEHHSNQIKKAFSVIEENGKTKGHNLAIKMVENRRSYEGDKNPFYGKNHSDETKLKMRKPKSNTEKMKKSEETKRKISNTLKGIKRSEESRKKMKEAKLNQPTRTCPHCGKEGRGGNMTRYHFDNCKTQRA